MDVTEKEPETAPVETAAQLPADTATPPIGTAPASSDDLDSLLEEFNRATVKPEPEPAPDNIRERILDFETRKT
jgi:hypothetical protein